ncbi:hypothetical protein GTN66_07460 [bacterium]|nr:hypothetical protein [bacterium]NIN93302.1 hypothetical protein [bacterium]NIO19097.1 hypothetical protein [bacterium]NIO74228.1 hypothetical protein [bacterium]
MKRCISILLSFLFLFLFTISFALTEKDYEHSMNFYQKLVEKKVSVEELIFTLQKILKKYSDIEVNLTPVREKLLTLRKFKISRDFYRKLEASGANFDERIAALKRIIIKFRNTDADLSGMERKLRQLQKVVAGQEEELEEFEAERGTGTRTIEREFEEGEISGVEFEEEVEDLEEFKEFEP